MIVGIIKDKHAIKSVLMTEGIAKEIGYTGEDFPIPDDFIYIAGYFKGELFGICIYEPFRDSVELHMNIIPGFRQQCGKEFGTRCLDLGPSVIYAQIPDDYQNVLNYAQSFGFEVIEKDKGDNILRYEKWDSSET